MVQINYISPVNRHLITWLLVVMTGIIPFNGHSTTKITLSYKLDKKNQKVDIYSIYSGQEIKLDKSQFDTPHGIFLMMKDCKKDSLVFFRDYSKDILSGTRLGKTGSVSLSREEIIFHTDSLLPGYYLTQFRIVQENGDVFIVDKKEKL